MENIESTDSVGQSRKAPILVLPLSKGMKVERCLSVPGGKVKSALSMNEVETLKEPLLCVSEHYISNALKESGMLDQANDFCVQSIGTASKDEILNKFLKSWVCLPCNDWRLQESRLRCCKSLPDFDSKFAFQCYMDEKQMGDLNKEASDVQKHLHVKVASCSNLLSVESAFGEGRSNSLSPRSDNSKQSIMALRASDPSDLSSIPSETSFDSEDDVYFSRDDLSLYSDSMDNEMLHFSGSRNAADKLLKRCQSLDASYQTNF